MPPWAGFTRGAKSGALGKYPTEEWDMSPFREALGRFVQSEDVIVRRPSSRRPRDLQRELQQIASDPPIKSFKPSNHSILSLLQLYDSNRVINEVQTQTNLGDMPANSTRVESNRHHGTSAAVDDDSSGKRAVDEDECNEGSFPSYGSVCNEVDEANDGISSPRNHLNSQPIEKYRPSDDSPPGMMLVGIPSQVQPSRQHTQAREHEQSESYALTADFDSKSRKFDVDEDDYDEESFPSYDSKTCNEYDDAHDCTSSPLNEGKSQSHDGAGASPELMHHGLPSRMQPSQRQAQPPRQDFATEAGLDASPRQYLQHNQKGCAWVFDMD
jgi:hypothetical protein